MKGIEILGYGHLFLSKKRKGKKKRKEEWNEKRFEFDCDYFLSLLLLLLLLYSVLWQAIGRLWEWQRVDRPDKRPNTKQPVSIWARCETEIGDKVGLSHSFTHTVTLSWQQSSQSSSDTPSCTRLHTPQPHLGQGLQALFLGRTDRQIFPAFYRTLSIWGLLAR